MAQKKIQQDQTDGLVKGPASSTDNAIARYDGTTGKLVQDSVESTIDDSGIMRLGPAESDSPYSSARFRFSDNTGDLSDASFTAYGGGYPVFVFAASNGTASAPTTLTPGDYPTIADIVFKGRTASSWQTVAFIRGYMSSDTTGTAGVYHGGLNFHFNAGATQGIRMFVNGSGAVANSMYLRPGRVGEDIAMGVSGSSADTNVNVNLYPKGTGRLQVASVNVPTISSTDTLTNKRITTRISDNLNPSGPYTIAGDNTDLAIFRTAIGDLTFNAPSGTPTQGQKLMIRIADSGTARTLTWNAIFRAIGVTLPTTTVISKTLYVGCVYNSTDTKWDVIAVAQEA